MDVTCERCSTEYEFDETLVAARGTTVKCTNCGHLFKVFRPGGSTNSSATEPRMWTIRRDHGASVETISSLKELQRMITAGRLSKDDEISRSGGAWKRLGDIAELQTFFAAAQAARSSRPDGTESLGIREPTANHALRATIAGHGLPKPPSTPPPVTDARAYAPTVEPPEPRRSSAPPRPQKATILGLGHAAKRANDIRGRTIEVVVPPPAQSSANEPRPTERTPIPRAAPPSRAPGLGTPDQRALSIPKTQMDLGSQPQDSTRPPPSRSRRPVSVRPASPDPARNGPIRPLHVDEEDEFSTRQRGRSWSGVWVALVVLLAAAVGIAQGWDRIAGWFGTNAAPAPVEPFLRAGHDALRLDHHEAYRDAATHFTKALAFDEHDARALSGLSRAHALIAQQRLFEASDVETLGDPAERATASALRAQASEHIEQAREHAEAAIRYSTGHGDVEIALSDALRLSRDFDLAESRLARGRTLETTPSAEASRVEALIAADRAGELAAARPAAERAVAEDPGLIRARLLLARAELASGNIAAAQNQLRAVLDRVSDHPLALAMQRSIARAQGSIAPAQAPAPPPEAEPAGQPAQASESTPSALPRGYDALVREAEQRLENGDNRRARALFEQALRERSNGPEALAGLGFVMLSEGHPRGAIRQLERAIARGSFDALIGLGDAYRRLNDREQALRSYQRFLEHTTSGPRASIARRQVERLSAELAASQRPPSEESGESPEPAPPSTP